MMNIAHFEAGKSLFGGAYQVAGLIARLQGEAFHHCLLAPRGSAIASAAAPWATVRETAHSGELDPRPYFALLRMLREQRPDLLHIHSRRGADIWGPIAARRCGVPFIVSRRVDSFEPAWWMRRKLAGASAVVGISERICEVTRQMGIPAATVRCIRSGVDTAVYQPRPDRAHLRQALGVPPEALTIGMIAQFIPRKGHRTLVEAAPAILEAFPQAVFVLFGKGRLRREIEAAVMRAGLSSAFRFPGFRDDMPLLLPSLDVVTHPAFKEGLGVAVLQASACGVPVVAGDSGGLPEIVLHDRTGFLVSPGDARSLARRILQLLGDTSLRRSMGQAARQWAVDALSLDATAAGNAALYRELTGKDASSCSPSSPVSHR